MRCGNRDGKLGIPVQCTCGQRDSWTSNPCRGMKEIIVITVRYNAIRLCIWIPICMDDQRIDGDTVTINLTFGLHWNNAMKEDLFIALFIFEKLSILKSNTKLSGSE